MQKIKRILYDKIINSKLSRLEIMFLFYLASRCDAAGNVVGIYYETIKEDLNCSVAKFYHLRDRLAEKGFISWEKNNSADIDVKLLENSFIQLVNGIEEVVYEDYVDINIAIFQDKEFFKCKAGAIQMAMEFIKRVSANGAVTATNSESYDKKEAERKRKLWYLPYNEYKKLAKLLNVSTRIVKQYLREELSPWISLAHNIINDGKAYDVITVLKEPLLRPVYNASDNTKRKKSKVYPERYQYMHFVKTFCRRKGILLDTEDKNLIDTADLIKQYRSMAKEQGRNIFNLLSSAINNTSSMVLNSYNVHSALKNLIKYNKQDSPIYSSPAY